MGFKDRLMHAVNAFTIDEKNRISTEWGKSPISGGVFGGRQDRVRLNLSNDRSIMSSIVNRIGIDVAANPILHVKLTDGAYKETVDSKLNRCLTVEANIDQTPRAFVQDVVMTMLDKGVVAIVPVETDLDPNKTDAYEILSMRAGEIVHWMPKHVRVNLYNEETGQKQEVTVAKKTVAIIENPLYAVMNEPNGTLQRLIRKLGYLDTLDEQASSGKLDLIVQLPYVVKTETRRDQANTRRAELEMQLKGSKYGVAYTDSTEKITQLNRPVENNMLKQVEYLTNLLYSQLGLTAEVFEGKAEEAVMVNYFNRTLEPMLAAITQAMKRSFLSKTAITQGQSIESYRDPFKLVTIANIAEIGDKFIRNEIMTANEIRRAIGVKPSKDPNADKLRNPNMPVQAQPGQEPTLTV